MEISSDKSKMVVKAIHQHMDEWKALEEGGKDQTGVSILTHDKASKSMEKQSDQFSQKD